MAQVQHHIIRREVLDVAFAGTEGDGLALQRRLADLCHHQLSAALEAAFARSVPAAEHWIVERLEIDAGSFPMEGLDAGFADAVAAAAERQITDRAARLEARARPAGPAREAPAFSAQADERMERRTEAGAAHEALVHFLATGALPWWFLPEPGRSLEQQVMDIWSRAGSPELRVRALMATVRTPAMRLRLARQFSTGFLEALLDSVASPAAHAVREILSATQHGAFTALARMSGTLWRIALMSDGPDSTGAPALLEALEALRVQTRHGVVPGPAEIEKLWAAAQAPSLPPHSGAVAGTEPLPRLDRAAHAHQAPGSELDVEEGLYVEDAGLVLLHPFLPQLFAALRIVADGEMVEPERALRLLHFLATGERFAPEHALVLPKRLCGLEPEAPSGAPDGLTPDEEEEATALLKAVIEHWGAIGQTSVEGLREAFLMRPGKLSRRAGEDLLQVETRSLDVLLDRLPWGVGAVQLPWMPRILWVEWG